MRRGVNSGETGEKYTTKDTKRTKGVFHGVWGCFILRVLRVLCGENYTRKKNTPRRTRRSGTALFEERSIRRGEILFFQVTDMLNSGGGIRAFSDPAGPVDDGRSF